jgi:hypothetical protein
LVTAVQDVALFAVEKLVPATQDTQLRSYVMEGGGLENWPGLHVTFHAVQDVEFGAVLNWPAGHSVQVVCAVAVPGPVVVVPAGQMMNGVQVTLFSVELKLPAAHAAQVRSTRVVPSAVTEVPATQVVLLMQGVAGLLSSSHVPAAHVTGTAVPPTQEVPGVQAAQVGSVFWSPGAV